MQVLFTQQFARQIKKVNDKRLAREVELAILNVKQASILSEVHNLKKLKGSNHAYRIRLGDYRIGLFVSDTAVEFACFMNRKEIYRYFP
jgi:mRNA interferase RelE/StbE